MQDNSAEGAEAILKVCDSYEVDRVFCCPGSEWPPMWEALAKRRNIGVELPHYVNCRHEELAISAAIAYHVVTQKIPIVLLHTTVGVLKGSMAIRMAYKKQIPMIILAGGSSTFGEAEMNPGSQWLRSLADVGGPSRFASQIVKWASDVADGETMVGTLRQAFEVALSRPPGPAFVYVPFEVMLKSVPVAYPKIRVHQQALLADHESMKEISKLLSQSRTPLIITENAGRDPKTVRTLVELSEKFAIPVVESLESEYMNFPRDHPLHLGFEASSFLTGSDLILLIGVSGPWYPPSKWPLDSSRVVLINEDNSMPSVPYWNYPIDIVVSGNLQGTMNELLKSLDHGSVSLDSSRLESYQRNHAERSTRLAKEAIALSEKRPMDTKWVCYILGKVIPENAIVVEETTNYKNLVNFYLPRSEPGTFFRGCAGGLGTGLGFALGAKLATKERIVVALMGDGAFNFSPALPCLGFAKEHETPILIVIMNNSGYASQRASLRRHFGSGLAVKTGFFYGAELEPDPDYAGIVKSFGGYGERVEDPKGLEGTLLRAIKTVEAGQLTLVDIIVEPGEPVRKNFP